MAPSRRKRTGNHGIAKITTPRSGDRNSCSETCQGARLDSLAMKESTFHIDGLLFDRLNRHLFPGDGDEHGALILAGVVETPRETRFLAREIVLARDGLDFVPGQFGY